MSLIIDNIIMPLNIQMQLKILIKGIFIKNTPYKSILKAFVYYFDFFLLFF
jgi:hypothetical protein